MILIALQGFVVILYTQSIELTRLRSFKIQIFLLQRFIEVPRAAKPNNILVNRAIQTTVFKNCNIAKLVRLFVRFNAPVI